MNTKDQVAHKLKEIAAILSREYNQEADIGVLAGTSGIALFLFYFSKYLDTDEYSEKGLEVLSDVIERINQGYQTATYCSGIAGAGWTFDHLFMEDFIDIDNDELLTAVDNYLSQVMYANLKDGYYDFLHGGIGYAFHFLKRRESTNSDSLAKQYDNHLKYCIDELGRTAIKDENGLKWESQLDIETKIRGYNLSLSHGMSSIVIFLAKLYKFDHFRELVKPLLLGAIHYLQSKRINDQTMGCLYPSWIRDVPEKEIMSRVAWCYGDLGIGLALWHASKALMDKTLKIQAVQILEHSANRRLADQTLVKDAGICHGAFGNAQIFNYIYHETKEIIFQEAATFWIEEGLKMASFKDGYAGFKQWNAMSNEWDSRLSILDGIAGIGLVLIDYISDTRSNWDECLMIS